VASLAEKRQVVQKTSERMGLLRSFRDCYGREPSMVAKP
jgi:hypothetical protein